MMISEEIKKIRENRIDCMGLTPSQKEKVISASQIIDANSTYILYVCSIYFHTNTKKMLKLHSDKSSIDARNMAWLIMKEVYSFSNRELSLLYMVSGDTISLGLRNIRRKIQEDDKIAKRYSVITDIIKLRKQND